MLFEKADKYQSEFENVAKIASGAFGTVFKVRNLVSGQFFAAKYVK